jgi:hypothetical protein
VQPWELSLGSATAVSTFPLQEPPHDLTYTILCARLLPLDPALRCETLNIADHHLTVMAALTSPQPGVRRSVIAGLPTLGPTVKAAAPVGKQNSRSTSGWSVMDAAAFHHEKAGQEYKGAETVAKTPLSRGRRVACAVTPLRQARYADATRDSQMEGGYHFARMLC